MLIDYLEGTSAELRKMKSSFQEMNRQYRKFYSRDIRSEMTSLKSEIQKLRREINEQLYFDLEELILIKKHFPDFFNTLLEDDCIGELVKSKAWLIERKEESKEEATARLKKIKSERKQLCDARAFLDTWPRTKIDSKSLTATWPILKGLVKGELEKSDALESIKKKDNELKREGWKELINESMVDLPLKRFLARIKKLHMQEEEKEYAMHHAKGKGSVKEYDALKELESVQKERTRAEKLCIHLLLANRNYLIKIKKKKQFGRSGPTDLERLAMKIQLKKISENPWLREMKERLGTG